MSRIRRLTVLAAVMTTACALATQANALSYGSPSASHAPDAARAFSPAATYHSQTPPQVAHHTATLLGAVAPAQHLRVTVGVKLPHPQAVNRFNAAVQNRKSPLFHKYLTAAQWNARFAPSAATQAKITSWARTNGLAVTHTYANHLLVDLDGTAAALESALHVQLNRYSLHGKTFFSNDRNPVLPTALRSVVSSVDGLNNIATLSTDMPAKLLAKQKTYSPGPVVSAGASAHANGSIRALHKAMKADARTPFITGGAYDPTDVYSSQMYDENALHNESSCCNPTGNSGGTSPTTSIAIATVGNQAVSDMQGFQARYGYLAYDFNEINIDGTPTCCDGEGTMDLEWSTALSNSFGSFQDTAHVYMYDGVNAQISTFNDIFNTMLSNGFAKIVSSSWGCAEDVCYSTASMDTNHNIFNAMIGQGYTLLNASDDHGAHADCTSTYRVQYPASDPDFLAISATNLELDSSGNYLSEGAWQGNSAGCANNGGGGGGGCSDYFTAPSYQLSPANPNYFCGTNNGLSKNFKTVPDVSLNGDWLNSPQNLYFNGGFQGNGGTSIAAPEMAGFYAQQNSYGLSLANVCGSGSSPCAPIGQGGTQLYLAGVDHAAQGKSPYYDTTSGCTSNDAGPGFCGISGYDRATGWGTVNMLQLAWANNYWNMPEAGTPTISMSGPGTNQWFNAGTLSWSIVDTGSPAPSGVSGWTARWDADPGDPSTEAHPGSGNSFYSGPASAHGSTSGSLALSSAGEGCHTLYVRAWDNIGESSVNTYGPVCYDATAPSTPAAGTAKFVRGAVLTPSTVPVRITWGKSTDALSGVAHYNLWQATDGGAYSEIATPTANSYDVQLAPGHTYQFAVDATDNAGNYGSFAYNPAFKLSRPQENVVSAKYAGTWTKQTTSNALANALEFTTQKHATVTYKFKGIAVAWVGVLGPDRSNSAVTLDGGAATNVSGQAASTTYKVIEYQNSFANASHTLVIDNNATTGRARIDVDAFAVIQPA